MAKDRILQNAVRDETRRTIPRESLNRYRNELMDIDEREVLWNRILRLRRQLKIDVGRMQSLHAIAAGLAHQAVTFFILGSLVLNIYVKM
jgi:hypothetical protein